MWGSISALKRPKLFVDEGAYFSVALVHSNSRRQRSAFYGGLVHADWSLVFDKHLIKVRVKDLNATMNDIVARWTLFLDRYPARYNALKDFTLSKARYNQLLVAACDSGYLSWSRAGPFHRERPDDETGLSFLKRFSAHAGKQPPISHEPSRNQAWSMFGMMRKVTEEMV
jgi:hypothetical protein